VTDHIPLKAAEFLACHDVTDRLIGPAASIRKIPQLLRCLLDWCDDL